MCVKAAVLHTCVALLSLLSGDVTGVATGSGHTHAGIITQAQLEAGVAVTISFSGNGHTHNLPLSAEEVQQIAQGQRVQRAYMDSHAHTYTFTPPSQVEGWTWGGVKQLYRK